MNRPVVVDASVALTMLLKQEGVQDVDARLDAWSTSGTRLLVPSHFWMEVSNALVRRRGVTGVRLIESIHLLDELGLETADVDRPMLLFALDAAERTRLTVYDATYLALAELMDAHLYTSDQALLAAAGPRGLAIGGGIDHRLCEPTEPYEGERRSTWPSYSGASAYLARLRVEVEARLPS